MLLETPLIVHVHSKNSKFVHLCYLRKIESYIAEVKKEPTKKYQQRLKTVMKDCDMANEKTCEMNPTARKLKGPIKLHKESRLTRPLVNCIKSPNYRIAKIEGKLPETI